MSGLKDFILETVCSIVIMVIVASGIAFSLISGINAFINHDFNKKCIKISDEMPRYEYVGLTPTNQCVYKCKETNEVKVLNVGD